MAGAKPGVHVLQLKPIAVPESLIEGEKFIKWDEDSGVGIPVTLRVDANGFFLYWTDQNKEVDFLDISTIRDTRTGRQAKLPKDPKLRELVTMGSQDTLEEKTLTVCYGPDFINCSFINFCCNKKETAKLWTDELFRMAHNLLALNSCQTAFLKKVHTKITLMTDKTGKIPVKNIVKMFAQHKDDKKRVERALDAAGMPSGKNDTINPSKFQFEDFFNFYKNLVQRTEVEKVFEEFCGSSKKKLMSVDQLVNFLNEYQRDPRLNEILYPYANPARAKDIINQYEPNKYNTQKGYLSFDGFLRYLMSDDNAIVSPEKFDLNEDMEQPLTHYFINSSHNTYLTGHQLTGKSSVEIYRQCLLAGCRCVELDLWNGRTEEPIIVHGYTLVPEISAKEVIEAIADSAFKTSDYPVVLSFENHCNPRQQAKIAQYCREFFGEMLLDSPLESYPLEANVTIPSPATLKRKILIKNKKKHHHRGSKRADGDSMDLESPTLEESHPLEMQGNGDIPRPHLEKEESKDSNEDECFANGDVNEDDESPSDDDEDTSIGGDENLKMEGKSEIDKGTAGKESEAGAEISALVNYIQPVHFHSFEHAEKKGRSYEMSSFVETTATALLKEFPVEFVNYNKRQLSRLYPKGTRVDSSNYMPQVFWNAGCQLVALNYQTLDLPMQLNLGIFEYNKRCGYLLKPDFMRRVDRRFDPFAESTVDGIIAGTVSVQVISGQFLSDKRVGTYVEVDMYGLPADTVRRKFRTKIVPCNGINPVYNEDPFVFKKVVLPDLACLRISTYEESGRFIGHRVLPVIGLCPGYRHIALRNESEQPLTLPSLFVHITVKDYIPDGLSALAEALANPIKYQSELEKRSQQLSVLTDDDIDEVEEDRNVPKRLESKKSKAPSEIRKTDSVTKSPVPGLPASPHGVTQPNPPSTSVDSGGGCVPDGPMNGDIPQISSSSYAGRKNSTRTNLSVKSNPEPESVSAAVTGTPSSPRLENVENEMVAESVARLIENKIVKEKKMELEKKLEQLRKKYEKEKLKIQELKTAREEKLAQEQEKNKCKIQKSQNKLVKKLSNKNMDISSAKTQSDADLQAIEAEHEYKLAELQRNHSEKLLLLKKDLALTEKELQEKHHDVIYNTLEKVMKTSQANQIKQLQMLHDKESAEVKRNIDSLVREEIKSITKKHKDKDELERVKREKSKSIVDRGLQERKRLKETYLKKEDDLEKQHEEVRRKFEEEKQKALNRLSEEYDEKCAKIEKELSLLSKCGNTASGVQL